MRPVAITLGDPIGVGCELVARIAAENPRLNIGILCPPSATNGLGLDKLARLKVWPKKAGGPFLFWAGRDIKNVESMSARRALVVGSIETAVRLASDGEASAVVTGPTSKELLARGKKLYPGQTELIAELCGTKSPVMAFWVKGVLVALLTTHIPLRAVPRSITRRLIVGKTTVVHSSLERWFGIEKPRIAVAGLNPHAGESGLLGTEERRIFAPALDELQRAKVNILGPIAADTALHRALTGEFDAVVACYHDQALPAVKTADFTGSVHLTLGLPIIRTSPAHGPAYGIAGKGVASERSFLNAIRLARRLAKRQKR